MGKGLGTFVIQLKAPEKLRAIANHSHLSKGQGTDIILYKFYSFGAHG